MILSRFRRSSLWQTQEQMWTKKLQKEVSPVIAGVLIELCYYVESCRHLRNEELSILHWLLAETFEPEKFGKETKLNGLVSEVGPRLNWNTPQSDNAVSICQACGLDSVSRIEQSRRFRIVTKKGSVLTPAQNKQIYALTHDRMTEQPYPAGITSFDSDIVPEPVQVIPLLKKGVAAIQEANERLGLAIPEYLAEYIFQHYQRIGRNPTDAELFMLGQLNSNHCRHLDFNAKFIIDDQEMPETLFEMIKSTTEANPGNVMVAYKDNAAVLSGHSVMAFMPADPITCSPFELRPVSYCIVLKVETHNHPTAIAPGSGAGTGYGGVIRDVYGTGRGATPTSGLALYYVANLLIPGYSLPWEKEYALHPGLLQTPLEIIIGAPNGAHDYGNKIGLPVVLGSRTSFEQMVGQDHYGWKKTCMVAGSSGLIDQEHVQKLPLKEGYKVVQLGGDAYRIGLGGGSGSSKDAGTQDAERDFESVQRAGPEMEERVHEVIRACSELGRQNPIVTATDLGAGGDSVAGPELVYPVGARYELRKIPCGDKTMAVYVIWCNESQERMLLAVKPEDVWILKRICQKNRCPISVIGEVTGDGKLVLVDSDAPDDAPREQKVPIDLDMNFLLADLPQTTIECQEIPRQLNPLQLPDNLSVEQALQRVLRLLKVASSGHIVHRVDRSVGGLSAQQQTVGPLQLPLADCAVIAHSFWSKVGRAEAIGEQPIKGLVKTEAGGKMSLGESLTNLVWALVEEFDSINFSATWQWPCNQPGEDARLYDTVKAVCQLCRDLGLRIPVGKDSLSMTAQTKKDGKKHSIKAPGTVQMISFAPCPDITKVVTPDIKEPGKSKLMLIDLSGGKQRLGGSALAQAYEQIGDEAPDVDNPHLLKNGFQAVQEMIKEDLILAGHDRSDGGLITCLLEMAFAGNCGLDINFQDESVWGKDTLSLLFSEELGLVIEYLPENEKRIRRVLERYGLGTYCHIIGETIKNPFPRIRVNHNRKVVLDEYMPKLRDAWQETSFRLDALQANPKCVRAERSAVFYRSGPSYQLSFEPEPTCPKKLKSQLKPRVAILREEGTNGHREMAGAFFAAGFEPWEVTMTHLAEGQVSLANFRGIALAGGFSFADVLDAGKGWAGVIRFNPKIREEFEKFYQRDDTFSLGVCNGCQAMTPLGRVPWQNIEATKQPRFVKNPSGVFESRFAAVKILASPSIFLQGMEGSILGIWVAHGEGRAFFPDTSILIEVLDRNLAPLRFVDDNGCFAATYPFNPNGSTASITALCSPDGRHLAMMPHPERLFLSWQWPYWPREWSNIKASPWLRLFQNARKWCEEN